MKIHSAGSLGIARRRTQGNRHGRENVSERSGSGVKGVGNHVGPGMIPAVSIYTGQGTGAATCWLYTVGRTSPLHARELAGVAATDATGDASSISAHGPTVQTGESGSTTDKARTGSPATRNWVNWPLPTPITRRFSTPRPGSATAVTTRCARACALFDHAVLEHCQLARFFETDEWNNGNL